MTGHELKALRRELGLSVRDLAAALAYIGNDNTNSVLIRQMMAGEKRIPLWRVAYMFAMRGDAARAIYYLKRAGNERF